MAFRKVLFWMHLAAGSAAGVVILIMSVTGTLLMYERQMTAWADGYSLTPPPGAQRLPIETLASRVREARTEPISSITVRREPSAPVAFGLGREVTLFVDPYSGGILGEGSKRARVFFHEVTDWHRFLGTHGDRRAAGRAITGASNLLFLFIVLSGIYLWWPKTRTFRHVKPVVLFQGGLRGKARDFNWHNVIGIWSAVPLAFVVASAVVISYPWAADLVYRVTGSEPPVRRSPQGPGAAGPAGPARSGGPSGERTAPPVDLSGLDRMWGRAEQEVSAWQSVSLRLPNAPDAPWSFSVDTSSGARRPDRRAQVSFDRTTGELKRVETYQDQSSGRRVVGWLRFIHTGEAFGLAGQTLAGLVSAGGAVLVYTGLALALRRLFAWRARRAASAPSVAGEPSATAG
jgi:uncharacterized iron-regulated membrane protein